MEIVLDPQSIDVVVLRKNADTVRELVKREHDLLTSRVNFYLLVEPVLLAAIFYTKEGNAWSGNSLLVALVAISMAMFWIFTGHRNIAAQKFFWKLIIEKEQALPEIERIYTYVANDRAQTRRLPRLATGDVMAYALPLVWLIGWAVLLSQILPDIF